MFKIKIVNKDIFLENLLNERKELFCNEYKRFWHKSILKWFYIWNEFICGVWLGYNEDFFNNTEWKKIIEELNNQNYCKISYFFCKSIFQWKWYWKQFLSYILENNKQYFLSCHWEKLKSYYISLWFKEIYNENEKYILTKSPS